MTWVLWRQYRITALIAGALLALTIVFLLISGFHLMAVAQQSGLAICAHQDINACDQARVEFISQVNYEQSIAYLWLFLLPLLIGLFVGAPLIAREWEQGTYRLAWTQSVSRTRWLISRLSVFSLVLVLASLILTLLSSWWISAQMSMNIWAYYDIGGVMPVVYMLFAFALGTASGTLFRKTLPAMAVTLLLFLLVRLVIVIWLRPHFLPPVMTPILHADQKRPLAVRQGWQVQYQNVDRQGHPLSDNEVSRIVRSCDETTNSLNKCISDRGLNYYALYQPADRFWLFQGIETILYLVFILGLLWLTTWLVRKRLC